MAKSKPPYFCFYPADFVSDPKVIAMSAAGVGAYIRLLCAAWSDSPPGSVPNDDRVLARIAGMTPDEWRDVRPEVEAAFSLGTDGRLHQKRLREEYERYVNRSQKASAAGRKGGSSKAEAKRTPSERLANAKQRASGSDSDSDSSGKGGSGGKGKRPREPDPIWDAVCEVFGLNPVTKSDKTRIGKIVRDLKAKQATADEIRRRIDRYRREWPNAADTPEALEKHWDRFAASRNGHPAPQEALLSEDQIEDD